MNIFDNLIPSSPSERTAFDLNQRHLFSQKMGQDLPCFCLDLLPKDYVELNLLSLVRTLPINTAAFARMNCRFQFVFVPYQQLWHGWNQFFLQTQERMSIGSSFTFDSCPRFSLLSLLINIEYAHAAVIYYRAHPDETPSGDADEYLSLLGYLDTMGVPKSINAVRMLDMLGYGSYYCVLEALEATFIPTNVPISSNLKKWSSLETSETLKDYTLFTEVFNNQYVGKYFNAFRILAYHKAWQDYFMNKRVEPYNPEFFNVDHEEVLDADQVFQWFGTINYHPYPYDLFTGLYNTPQAGDISVIGSDFTFKTVKTTSQSSDDRQLRARTSNGNVIWGVATSNDHFSMTSGFSVYDIKRAEYLQHWKENKLRAGNKLQNQAKAQWNARFKYLSDEYSEYVDEFILNVSIDEVINTAENQGDISGKGIGTNSGKFSFETEDAGVLLCICSVTPNIEYDSVMIDKQNTCIEPFDWPSPFFDKLGFEAVPAYLLSMLAGSTWQNKNLGYTSRYYAWKTAVDKVHGSFQRSGHFSDIIENTTNVYSIEHNSGGSLYPWAIPRADIQDLTKLFPDSPILPQRFYYVSPDIANTVFADTDIEDINSDHFLFNCNFVTKIVRSLSGIGLPNWM